MTAGQQGTLVLLVCQWREQLTDSHSQRWQLELARLGPKQTERPTGLHQETARIILRDTEPATTFWLSFRVTFHRIICQDRLQTSIRKVSRRKKIGTQVCLFFRTDRWSGTTRPA